MDSPNSEKGPVIKGPAKIEIKNRPIIKGPIEIINTKKQSEIKGDNFTMVGDPYLESNAFTESGELRNTGVGMRTGDTNADRVKKLNEIKARLKSQSRQKPSKDSGNR